MSVTFYPGNLILTGVYFNEQKTGKMKNQEGRSVKKILNEMDRFDENLWCAHHDALIAR